MKLGDRTYKNHLDGYNQMDLLLGKGPSARHELFYFGGPQLGALRIDDFKFQFYQQPYGWPGEKVTTDMPTIVNIRQDPFERTPSIRGETLNDLGGGYMNDFYAREFWRFVLVQQEVGEAGADGDRLSADAGAGLLQSRGGQGAGRRGDQEPRRAVATAAWKQRVRLPARPAAVAGWAIRCWPGCRQSRSIAGGRRSLCRPPASRVGPIWAKLTRRFRWRISSNGGTGGDQRVRADRKAGAARRL